MIKSVKQLPKLKKRVLTPKQKQLHNFKLGKIGETKATAFLKQKGYQIITQNLRLANREVDIIAFDKINNELAFVEVKARKTKRYGSPSLAVGRDKLRSMQAVARAFLKKYKLKKDYRFDIISITPGSIDHFENITWYN